MTGYAAEQASNFPARISWRIIQGFEASADGAAIAGPGSLDIHSDSILHEPLPEARIPATELAERIAKSDSSEAPGLLIAARVQMSKGDMEATARLADRIAQQYPKWSPQARVLALTTLPPSSRIAPLKALDEQAAKDPDPKVLMVASIARAQNADDPILVAAGKTAVAANDLVLASLVSGQQERMRDGLRTFSQMGIPERAPAAPPKPPPAAPAAGSADATPPKQP
jgi:hypothetical protein